MIHVKALCFKLVLVAELLPMVKHQQLTQIKSALQRMVVVLKDQVGRCRVRVYLLVFLQDSICELRPNLRRDFSNAFDHEILFKLYCFVRVPIEAHVISFKLNSKKKGLS